MVLNVSVIHGDFSTTDLPTTENFLYCLLAFLKSKKLLMAERKPNSMVLKELETLSGSLYQTRISRRTASLILPRSSITSSLLDSSNNRNHKSISQRIWKPRIESEECESEGDRTRHFEEIKDFHEKSSIWKWKPMRAFTHLVMEKLNCLFSVEVITVHGLSTSMNGSRLTVSVKKKESKDGSVQTMPARVSNGSANFEETLFVRTHVYSTKRTKFEPKFFLISVSAADAADAAELDFGRSWVDLSQLIQESMEMSHKGIRIRQWRTSIDLCGKARGGKLIVKMGFQIIDKDGGLKIYSQPEGVRSPNAGKKLRASFNFMRPRISRQMDDLKLQKPQRMSRIEDDEIPCYEVIEKDVEIQERFSCEVFKGSGNDPVRYRKISELDSLVEQIKSLGSIFPENKTVLQKEGEVGKESPHHANEIDASTLEGSNEPADIEGLVYLPDLGKELGPVIQTRDGGFLVSMNPLEIKMPRTETPKLAMRISKQFVLLESGTGFEILQRIAASGIETFRSEILKIVDMDDLTGKTAEQIDFEGVASSIVNGEGASTPTIKSMTNAMFRERKQKATTGIWKLSEDPVRIGEIVTLSLQKIERMAMEALKIQADMIEEVFESSFEVDPIEEQDRDSILNFACPLEIWKKSRDLSTKQEPKPISMLVVLEVRDPLRQYEMVGSSMIVLVQAMPTKTMNSQEENEEVEERYELIDLNVGGLKLNSESEEKIPDFEKQKQTAMQWLLNHGIGKTEKKKMHKTKGQNLFWSISAKANDGIWEKSARNPDVRIPKKL